MNKNTKAVKAAQKSKLTDEERAAFGLVVTTPKVKPAKKAKPAKEQVAANIAAVEAPVLEKPAKKAKPAKEQVSKLDWAYRRLRYQAVLYFAPVDAKGKEARQEQVEARKALKEQFEALPHSYSALRDGSGIGQRGWDGFMDHFFGHVIHPGSGNHGVQAALKK
jgi:hypothetical protein